MLYRKQQYFLEVDKPGISLEAKHQCNDEGKHQCNECFVGRTEFKTRCLTSRLIVPMIVMVPRFY